MGHPRDIHARKYYRVAAQRLEDAQLILEKIDRPAAVVYLAGYAIECILKALLLESVPVKDRPGMLDRMKRDFGHDLSALRVGLARPGVVPNKEIADSLLCLASWSPQLRYEPSLGNRGEAERFLREVSRVFRWADRRL